MDTTYRVMMKHTPDSEPEMSVDYDDLDGADFVSRTLTKTGACVEARIIRIDKHCGESVLPRVSRETR